MLKRAVLVLPLFGILSVCAMPQSYCPATSRKMACELPIATNTFGTGAAAPFNSTFALELSQLPLASAGSGFALTFDKAGNLTVASQDLGPVLTQRAGTIGKHKLFLAFSYQLFRFDSIDGTSLNHVPLVFNAGQVKGTSPPITDVGQTYNHIDARINQYVAQATFGLTDWADITIALPFERVSMGVTTYGTEYFVSTTGLVGQPVPISKRFTRGSASGISDMVLNLKVAPWKWEHFAMAMGVEFRIPTGDELNYLGSGALGWKPYIVLSRPGRITPHVNVGYQWSATSDIYPHVPVNSQDHQTGNNVLPDVFSYAAGAEASVVSRFTLSADFVGQRYIDAPRLLLRTNTEAYLNDIKVANSSLTGVTESYSADNLSAGAKVRIKGSLLFTGNALIKLDDGGLRAKVVPLAGLSYTF